MRIENGKLVFEKKNCSFCQKGQVAGTITCPECKGTGKGKRGKPFACKKCNGRRTTWSWDHPVTCSLCNGNYLNSENENDCDYLPEGIFQNMPMKVIRVNQGMTWNEEHLGMGCVFSCVDYGNAWGNNNDAELIATVKKERSIQATKIAKDDGTVANSIGIFVKPGGYSVRPIFN